MGYYLDEDDDPNFATNCLQPELKPSERAIVKQYGDWTNFVHSMGLKSYDDGDIEEAHEIVKGFAKDVAAEKRAEKRAAAKSSSSKSSSSKTNSSKQK